MTRILPCFLLALVLCGRTHAEQETLPPLDGKAAPKTIEALWAGFDPRAEALQIEVLKEWEEDGVVLKIVRYRIGFFKGRRAMMAGVYGHPKGGKKLPGLLNIHGGGQYADYTSVLTNAKRGYATLSIAWAGRIAAPGYRVSPAEVKLFWEGKTDDPGYRLTTDWGALDAYHAPCRNPKNAFAHTSPHAWTLDPVDSPRNNPWFLITLGARRGLTFLERQPEVDPGRLGVYGHSMGGKLTVLTTANDKRVVAAAPSCGGISNFDTGNALYDATIGDRANLERIACPILFLKPSNDFHGRINHLAAAVKRIGKQPWRVSCSPHHNHKDTAEYHIAGLLWMDQYLKRSFTLPETPVIRLELDTNAGHPIVQVTPDPSREIVSVDVYYTQQGEPAAGANDRINAIHRHWHHAAPRDAGGWFAALPLSSIEKPLWVFANVQYRLDTPQSGAGYYFQKYTADSVTLSSLMEIATPGQLKAAGVEAGLKPALLIEDFEGDWRKEWFNYKPANWDLRTHKVYHPLWKAPPEARLALQVGAREPNKMVVGLDDYAAELTLKGGPVWQNVSLAASDFTDANGTAMESFQGIRELRFLAAEHLRGKKDGEDVRKRVGGAWKGAPPNFKNLRWVKPAQQRSASGRPEKPNILLLLTDDLGWQDVSCYDIDEPSPMETPNIDALAKKGVLFWQAYAPAPTCSPSRCAILSGIHPARAQKTHVVGGAPPAPRHRTIHRMMEPWYSGRMPEDTFTLAKALRQHGYTTGHSGKWHMAIDHHAFPQPEDQGFDWTRSDRGSRVPMRPDRLTGFATDKAGDSYRLDENGYPYHQTNEDALAFLREHTRSASSGQADKPFFLYYATWLVHSPIHTRSKARLDKYCKKLGVELPEDPQTWDGEGQTNPFYCAMVEELDYYVGQVFRYLETTEDPRWPGHKLVENTYIIFTSDNGGMEGHPGEIYTDNYPLDRGKISAMEGGTRVPLIITGPGIRAGIESEVMVNGLDFYPTLLTLTGAKQPAGLRFDGADLAPLLLQDPADPSLVKSPEGTTRDTLVWHFPHGPMESTIRVGGYKLVRNYAHVINPREEEFELYQLYENRDGRPIRVDIEEAKNLAAARPEKTRELNRKLTEILTEMKASYPYYNPDCKHPIPHKDKVCTVLSHREDGNTVTFTYRDNGARVTRADLLYTLNGGERYEEWFRGPAKILPGGKVSARLPGKTTHYFINLVDEHNFLRSYPQSPLTDGKIAYSEAAIAVAR